MSATWEPPRVAVVILNWNGRDHTLACLNSIAASKGVATTSIVVDNASSEDIAPLSTRFPQAVLIRNTANLGFAGGMNVGIEYALGHEFEYILLLNNDTIVEHSMIQELVAVAAAREDAGIVSPLVLSQGERSRVISAGWEFDPRRGHPGRPVLAGEEGNGLRGVREVVATSGEAMLVSARVARTFGGLDESLYLRLEDIDWSLRMRAGGLRNLVALEARLWHAVSASSGGKHSALSAYYHTRNILVVCTRHAPLPPVRSLLREAEVLVANLVHARRSREPGASLRAVLAGWRDFRRRVLGARSASD